MLSNSPNLMVVRGHDTGRQVPVGERASITIGRGDGCAFQLHDPSVSRVHCQISKQGDRLVISDEGSRWGMQVNGRAVREATLKDGDRITPGATGLSQCLLAVH